MIAVAVAGCTLPDCAGMTSQPNERTNERSRAKTGSQPYVQTKTERPTYTRRERRGQCFVQASEETRRPKSTSGKKTRDAYLAVVAAVPDTAGALEDWGRIALLHRRLHRRQNLSASRLCSQGLPAVEVVRHQHCRAPRVAACRLAAATVLRWLVAALVRHIARTVGQVRRLARRAVPPVCAGPAVQAR